VLAEARAGFEQFRGLEPDHPQIVFHRQIGVVHVHQLQHLTFGDDVGGVGKDLQHAHAVDRHHHLEGAGVDEVAHQHACRIAEQRIGGFAAAPQCGFVDDIVVQQGGGVDELDRCCQFEALGPAEPERLREQQHQARTDPFAAGADDVVPDAVDQRHVRCETALDHGVDLGHVGNHQLGGAEGSDGEVGGGCRLHAEGRREAARL